ncbi:MAG: hypothetical protein R3E68_04110 [Burkholderiaceae bacterium]
MTVLPLRPRLAMLLALGLVVAACDNLPLIGRDRGPSARPPVQAPPSATGSRGMTLAGHCDQREIDGYAENARLDLRNGTVHELSWNIQVGRRGSCRFSFDQFRQTHTDPVVQLLARNGSGCRLMVWGDPRRITLAHASCATFCSPGVYDKAWPVMFDPQSGKCADTER